MKVAVRWLPLVVLATLSAGIGAAPPAKSGVMRVYVTNSLGDDITVIDLGTLKAVGSIKVGDRVHGVCAQADGRRLFTTIESGKTLKVIDTATNTVVQTIPLTGRPNQCAATPDGRFVGVPIRDGDSVDIVDMTQGKVAKVLPVKVPHNCFNTGNNNDMYVSSMAGHEILRIDLKTMEYVERIPVGGIPRPYAVSNDEKNLYVALSAFHGFASVSIPGQKILERVELPPAPPSACALEPNTPTHGVALTPDGKELWVTSLADSGIYVYDFATRTFSKEIPTGRCPNWVSISPDGKYTTVSNSDSDDTSIIDARARREVARIKVGKGPKRLLVVNVPTA